MTGARTFEVGAALARIYIGPAKLKKLIMYILVTYFFCKCKTTWRPRENFLAFCLPAITNES
jgi:hypothetical protein